MSDDLLASIDALADELIALRREFHQIPELLFEVPRTSAKVAAFLAGLGLEVQTAVGKHFGRGVVATVDSGRPGRTVALRADMDGLAITEAVASGKPYRSQRDGLMHACGHDAHMAMLLVAAKALTQHRSQWVGRIKLIFQAAEESALPSPADGRMISGGRDVIEAGVLEDVEACFALHVWPDLPTGAIGVHPRQAMAASSHFQLAFSGLNGHHSTPHLAIDALSMAAQYVTDINYALAAELDPLETAVLRFGTLHAGTSINAIAGESTLSGTYRVLNPELVEKLQRILEQRAQAIAAAYGGSYTSRYRLGTPLINDAATVELVVRAGEQAAGPGAVELLQQPSLAGEDFALYLREKPGAMAFLGVGHRNGPIFPLHHPQFDIDEAALVHGSKLLAAWARLAAAACGDMSAVGQS